LATACPYVSWKWPASFSMGTPWLVRYWIRLCTFAGDPTPRVSPRLTS
jgi:hypothetical protein